MKTISSYTFKYLGKNQVVYPIVSKPKTQTNINQLLFYSVPMTKRITNELTNVLITFTCPAYANLVLSEIDEKLQDNTYEVAEYELGNLIDQTAKLNMPLITIMNSFCNIYHPDPVPPLFEPVDPRPSQGSQGIHRKQDMDTTETFELFYHYKPLDTASFVPFR